MSFSSEEELDELLGRKVTHQTRNFEEWRLFDSENPKKFRGKFVSLWTPSSIYCNFK